MVRGGAGWLHGKTTGSGGRCTFGAGMRGSTRRSTRTTLKGSYHLIRVSRTGRTSLNEGDEIECATASDHGDARTYWFQGRVVSVAKDEIFVRMQVLDPSVQQLEPWQLVTRFRKRPSRRSTSIKREVGSRLS